MLHMELARIIISETTDEQFIILKEVGGERAFPIVIGIYEAAAIDRYIKNQTTQRPLTHDLLASVLSHLDGNLERIIIDDLRQRTFFAKLVVKQNDREILIDSRPSDAIAIASMLKTPIYVEERVLQTLSENVVPPPTEEDEEE